eukprot:scaffold124952_cov20-Prasinocladus_malaysianus.AAC.2
MMTELDDDQQPNLTRPLSDSKRRIYTQAVNHGDDDVEVIEFADGWIALWVADRSNYYTRRGKYICAHLQTATVARATQGPLDVDQSSLLLAVVIDN